MLPHERPKLRPPFGDSGQAVESPGTNEGLWKCQIRGKDLLHSTQLLGSPLKKGQGPHNLKADLPLLAAGQRTEEDGLVRRDPLQMIVGEFLEQVQRPLHDEPVVIAGEGNEIVDE